MTRNVIACLWRGTDLPAYSRDVYGPDDVRRLLRGVRRHCGDSKLTILCDAHYAEQLVGIGVEVALLEGYGVGGWSNMLEAFRPGLRPVEGERALVVGLDTAFTGDCGWLFEWNASPVGMTLDPHDLSKAANAVVSYTATGAEFVWSRFLEARTDRMAQYQYSGKPSEMMLLRALYEEKGWEPLEREPKRLLSYKVHHVDTKGFEGASVVYFHGMPKPSDLPPDEPCLIA